MLIAEAIPPDQLEAGELRAAEEAEQRLSDAEEGSGGARARLSARRRGAGLPGDRRERLLVAFVQARALTEELIGYDTSTEEGIKLCAGFVKGWLDARDIAAEQMGVRGLPVTVAEVGPADGKPVLLLHGHLDVVPGRQEQFIPRIEGDRLYGRGAYDMKGALACLLLALADLRSQDQVRVRLGIVPDEESEEETDRGGDRLVEAGFVGDFAITGEPTDLNVGVAAKGVLAMRLLVSGRAAHGATPWLGENAILRAYEVFREVESLPFAGQSSELFDRPGSLGRIQRRCFNKVPIPVSSMSTCATCEQDRRDRAGSRARGTRVISTSPGRPSRSTGLPYVSPCGMPPALRRRDPRGVVGRDGASDAVSSCAPASRPWRRADRRGHGPEEWCPAGEVPPLDRYSSNAPRIAQ